MINIKMTEQEVAALEALIDAGVRQLGSQAVQAAAVVLSKIEKAKVEAKTEAEASEE